MFSTGEKEVTIYLCPGCSRNLTEKVVEKGQCPFCGEMFILG
jgi:hypothetical protein